MIKELHLVARILYSFLATLALSGVTGLALSGALAFIGVLIFFNSFVFQYFVLHFALKEVAVTKRARLLFLIGWLVICLAGLVGSGLMIPQMKDLELYASVEEFARTSTLWACVFSAFGAALVALTCTRRAWTRHGQLG
ncbi:MAG: hypothetical protein WC444_02835 [Candidatus Paceibacterota bacterium]